MRIVNRTAVSIVGAKPYIDWTLRNEGDVNRGTLTVARANTFGTAVLLPEFELEEDVHEWIEENATLLFEFQLSSWSSDEASWPPIRDLKAFREWFRVDIHNVVIDVGDDDIEGEEL
jgi:hypothetical protein